MTKRTKMNQVYYDLWSARKKAGTLEITCKEWIDWWIATGKWDQRGGKGGYYMGRYDTDGPWRLDNIYCGTRSEIMINYYKTHK